MLSESPVTGSEATEINEKREEDCQASCQVTVSRKEKPDPRQDRNKCCEMCDASPAGSERLRDGEGPDGSCTARTKQRPGRAPVPRARGAGGPTSSSRGVSGSPLPTEESGRSLWGSLSRADTSLF